jgi:small acid-soluble spore protein H (minor)
MEKDMAGCHVLNQIYSNRRIGMDLKRAKEICASPRMVSVTHIGIPVYIDSVSEDGGTANIHPLNQMDGRQTVNISSLTET